MSVEIIEADLTNPSHGEAVLALLNEYALDVMGGGMALSDFVQAHLVTSLHQRPGSFVILAFVHNQPVGLLIAFEGFSTFACRPLINIHDIVVTHSCRGQGIAKQLLAKIEAIALRLGACKLTLEVLSGNQVAQTVYRACGFSGYELDPQTGSALFWQKKL